MNITAEQIQKTCSGTQIIELEIKKMLKTIHIEVDVLLVLERKGLQLPLSTQKKDVELKVLSALLNHNLI